MIKRWFFVFSILLLSLSIANSNEKTVFVDIDYILNNSNLAGVHFTGSTSTFNHIWKTIGSNIDKYKTYPRIVGETGGKDFCFNHYFLKRWQTIFPTAELSLFPRYGHYILEDGRAEAETVIQRFMDKV